MSRVKEALDRNGSLVMPGVYDALSARIAERAGFDVFEQEPPVGSPLLKAPNCLFSPHVAGITIQTNIRTAAHCAAEIHRILHNHPPHWRIN